jgi:hypothetical protein
MGGDGLGDSIKRFILITVVLFLVSLPAFAPEMFIVVSVLAWPLIMLFFIVRSFFFDLSHSLPWFVFVASDLGVGHMVGYCLVFMCLGAVANGGRGAVAMLCFYGPTMLIPVLWTALGLGVVHKGGWEGYKKDMYTDTCKDVYVPGTVYEDGIQGRDLKILCTYVPNPGLELPSFTEDEKGGITDVVPYGGAVASRKSSQDAESPGEASPIDGVSRKLDKLINESRPITTDDRKAITSPDGKCVTRRINNGWEVTCK